MGGVVGTGNSTVEPLAADAVYTGKSDIVKDYADATISFYSDVASAPNGVEVQFSTDNDNWWTDQSFTLGAGETKHLSIEVIAYRMRVKFTNGSTAQTALRIQTIYHMFSAHTDAEEFSLKVSRGKVPGWSQYVWRCHNPDVDLAAAEDLVEWGGSAQYLTSAEIVELVSDNAADDAGSTGVTSVLVKGIDGNGNEQQEIVTMDGLTPAETVGTYLRVNQIVSVTCGTGGVNAGAITASAKTSGYTLSQMGAGEGISHSGIYTIPGGHQASFLGADINIVKPAAQDPVVTLNIWARTSGSAPWLLLFDITLDTAVQTFITAEAFNKASFPAGTDARVECITDKDDTDCRARLYLQLSPA